MYFGTTCLPCCLGVGFIDKVALEAFKNWDAPQWHSLSENFRQGMMNGIVGFEMTVTRLEGKYKLSQNRSHADQYNVAHTLLQSEDLDAHDVGVAMQQNLRIDQQ
ncbi:hypothetical protein VB735_17260 [Halotia wernerae UHCC 0503]|nr:hypothetical protein [Halotia wernerae UHCC 0503]